MCARKKKQKVNFSHFQHPKRRRKKGSIKSDVCVLFNTYSLSLFPRTHSRAPNRASAGLYYTSAFYAHPNNRERKSVTLKEKKRCLLLLSLGAFVPQSLGGSQKPHRKATRAEKKSFEILILRGHSVASFFERFDALVYAFEIHTRADRQRDHEISLHFRSGTLFSRTLSFRIKEREF